VAQVVGLPHWQFSFQSTSNTGEPWLGPDILETLSDLASQGGKHVLTVAIAFVSDHLEILFDIDIEAKELAKRLGLNLRRTEMPNPSPTFVDALADLVTNGTGARIADLDQTRVA
jgi:ferrochelatase